MSQTSDFSRKWVTSTTRKKFNRAWPKVFKALLRIYMKPMYKTLIFSLLTLFHADACACGGNMTVCLSSFHFITLNQLLHIQKNLIWTSYHFKVHSRLIKFTYGLAVNISLHHTIALNNTTSTARQSSGKQASSTIEAVFSVGSVRSLH
jgi:hypothetical protein